MNIKLNNTNIELTPNIKLAVQLNKNANPKWWKEIISFLEDWANDSKYITLKTSGSTGIPKTINIEKSKLWVSATKTCNYFKLNKNSTALLCLSVNYIAGKMMLVRAMVSGMNLICIEPSENPVKGLTTPIDFAAMVPMQVQQSITLPKKISLIKHLIIGGAKVNHLLISELKKHNVNAYETFGMTETLSHIAIKQIAPHYNNYFTPLNGIIVTHDTNNNMVIDYPELNIIKLKTNDIIEIIDNNGSFIWRGRTDFIINTGGVKIIPEEIEGKIAHLITRPYCIIGLPDKKLGQKAVLVISGNQFNTLNLHNKLTKLLPPYHCPKEIKFLEKFPVTNSGKIKRNKIIEALQ